MFQLYPQEQRIFPFEDYGSLIEMASGKKRVLEFGPGVSTKAFLEAGCEQIVSCEHIPTWYSKMVTVYADEPRVKVLRYFDAVPVTVDRLDDEPFDLAFVDSPKGDGSSKHYRHPGRERYSRLNTLEFALTRARLVLIHDALREGEQASLEYLRQQGHKVSMINTTKGIGVIERAG